MTQQGEKTVLLGIDTGSSKTHAIISTLSGQVLGFGESGSGNYEIIGLDGLRQALLAAVDAALDQAGVTKSAIAAMGLGICGYDWPSEKKAMIKAIESLGIPAPYQFVNDVVIGLIAGSKNGWGVAVDAGTGNNVRGLSPDGRMGRITGNSARFGEFGGASEMVWRGILAVTYAWSLRGPKTALTEAFIDWAGVPDENALIEGLATQQIHLPPSLAKRIFKVASQGDAVAQEIILWSARELGLNVNAVIRQIALQNETFDVVLIGSMFKAGEAYIQPLRETIHAFAPKAVLTHLKAPPVVGAVLLAAQTLGRPTQPIREHLLESTAVFTAQMEKNDPLIWE